MNNKYNLVLEALPGDFMPIDINALLNNQYKMNFQTLENIDAWTKRYTKREIMDKISESNIVENKYLNGRLHIINDKKYRFEVITKDNTFKLDTFIINNINDKQLMNKLVNIYQKYEKNNIDELKKSIQEKSVSGVLNIIFSLSYENIRNIYFYLCNLK